MSEKYPIQQVVKPKKLRTTFWLFCGLALVLLVMKFCQNLLPIIGLAGLFPLFTLFQMFHGHV